MLNTTEASKKKGLRVLRRCDVLQELAMVSLLVEDLRCDVRDANVDQDGYIEIPGWEKPETQRNPQPEVARMNRKAQLIREKIADICRSMKS